MGEDRIARRVYEARRHRIEAVGQAGHAPRANEWFTRLDEASAAFEMALSDPMASAPRRARTADGWANRVRANRRRLATADWRASVDALPSVAALAAHETSSAMRPYLRGRARPDDRSTRVVFALRMGTLPLRGAGNAARRPSAVDDDASQEMTQACSACLRRAALLIRETELHAALHCPANAQERDDVRQLCEAAGIPWSHNVLGRMIFGSLGPQELRREFNTGHGEAAAARLQEIAAAIRRLAGAVSSHHAEAELWRATQPY